MTITPTGNPPWIRSSDHSTYGGHTSKTNYQSRGVINPLTDVGAEAFVRLVADAAAAVRTSAFCVITYLQDDTGTADPTVESCKLMTGVTSASYGGAAPPSGFPTAVRNGDGDVTITFAASYADEYSVSGDFAPEDAIPSPHGTTSFVPTAVISGQTVRVRCLDSASAAVTDRRVTVEVW